MAEWTSEEDAKLRRLSGEGYSCGQVAAQFPGRSRCSIIGRQRRLDLGKGTKNPKRISQLPIKPTIREDKRFWPQRDAEYSRPPVAAMKPPQFSGPEPKPLMIPLLDLENHHCRWPVGDPLDSKSFGFCGHRADQGQTYCPFHRSVAWAGRPVQMERAA